MSDKDQSAEKSFEPTAKRLADARKRGDIAKSDEVTVLGAYVGLLVGAVAGGVALASGGGAILAGFLGHADRLTGVALGAGGGGVLADILAGLMWVLAPLFLLQGLGALAALMAQQAITVAPEKLQPKASRLSPLQAMKNRFGPTGLMEFAKRLVKMSAV